MITKRHLRELRDLGKKKPREERGRFLIEGLRMAEEAADSDFEIQEVLYTEALAGSAPGKNVLGKFRQEKTVFSAITERDMESISDTVTAQGIVAVVAVRTYDLESMLQPGKRSLLVGLDAVSDPGNLGSMIRTCDWFGVNGMVIGQGSVELYNPKVLRSTMGGLFHLPIVEEVNLLSIVGRLKGSGYTVYVADASGEKYAEDVRYADRAFIILGNEARGASAPLKHAADQRIAIRRYGLAESLNVGVACGVLLNVQDGLNDERTQHCSTMTSKDGGMAGLGMRLAGWLEQFVAMPYARSLLFAVAFIEGSIAPLPPDIPFIALSVARPRRAFVYGSICVAGSVAGAVAGYFIGWLLFDSVGEGLVSFYHVQDQIALLLARYRENAWLTLILAGFTSIPFCIFAMAAGFHQTLDLGTLFFACLAGRAIRFYLISTVLFVFGASARRALERSLAIVPIVTLLLLALGFLLGRNLL